MIANLRIFFFKMFNWVKKLNFGKYIYFLNEPVVSVDELIDKTDIILATAGANYILTGPCTLPP